MTSPGARRRGPEAAVPGQGETGEKAGGRCAGESTRALEHRGVLGGQGCAWSPQSGLTKPSEGGCTCCRPAEGDFPTCQTAGEDMAGEPRQGRKIAGQVCAAVPTKSHRPTQPADFCFLPALEAGTPDLGVVLPRPVSWACRQPPPLRVVPWGGCECVLTSSSHEDPRPVELAHLSDLL